MATLSDIYKTKGKVLPTNPVDRFSDADFSGAATKAGIKQDQYVGSEEQNNAISSYLNPPTVVTSTTPRKDLINNTNNFSQALAYLQPKTTSSKDSMATDIKNGQGEIDNELNTYVSNLDDISKRSSLATQNLIRGIGADYTARKAEESDSNSRYMRGLQLLGIQGNDAQATPILHAGTLRSAEIAGHKELARLDGEERKLIAEAEQAQLDNDFRLFNEKMNAYKSARAEKNKVVSDLYDQALNRRKLEEADIELVSSYATGLYDEFSKLNETEKAAYVQEVANQLGVSTMAVVAAMASEKQNRIEKASKGKKIDSNEYTDQEVRKLRQAGIDPENIIAADNFLYGDGVLPVKLTMTEKLAKKLTRKDVTSDDIIEIQNYLNEGYTLDQVQQLTSMPDEIYNIFSEGIQ